VRRLRSSLAGTATMLMLATLGAPSALRAQYPPRETNSAVLPAALRDVGFDQRLDQQVPLGLAFRDEQGREVRLADLGQGRPILLALAYYECPMRCTLVLNGLASSLKAVALDPGADFEVVIVSFDPSEGPELASAKREVYLERYGRPGTEAGWHFLTGGADQIRALTSAVGFRYQYDQTTQQFAHPSGIVLLTPQGRISRYLFGTDFVPRDVRLGLIESAAGKVGTAADALLLFCYHYDPSTGRYTAAVWNLLRAGGALTVLLLGAVLTTTYRRERRRGRNSV
jgi:protein SCO1/2